MARAARGEAPGSYREPQAAQRPLMPRSTETDQYVGQGRPAAKEAPMTSLMSAPMSRGGPRESPREAPRPSPRDANMMATQRETLNQRAAPSMTSPSGGQRAAGREDYPEMYSDPYKAAPYSEGQDRRQAASRGRGDDQYSASRSSLPSLMDKPSQDRNGRQAAPASTAPSNQYYEQYQRSAEPAQDRSRMEPERHRPMPGETDRRRSGPQQGEVSRSQAPETEMYASYPPSRPTTDSRVRQDAQETSAYSSYPPSLMDSNLNSRKRPMEGYPTDAGDARGTPRGRDDRGGQGGASSNDRGDSRNPPPKRERVDYGGFEKRRDFY